MENEFEEMTLELDGELDEDQIGSGEWGFEMGYYGCLEN